MIPAWISRLGAKLLPGLLAAGAFFALIAEAFRRGRRQADLEHAEQEATAQADAYRKAGEVRRSVDAAPDEQLDERMRRWQR